MVSVTPLYFCIHLIYCAFFIRHVSQRRLRLGDAFLLGDAFFLGDAFLLGDALLLGDAFFLGDASRHFKRGKDKD